MHIEGTIEIGEEGEKITATYSNLTGEEAIFLIAMGLSHKELGRVTDGLMSLYIEQAEMARAEKKKAKRAEREQRKARRA